MKYIVLLAFIATFVAGCTTTTVNQEWKDPAYQGRGVGSVLVVGFPMNSPVGHNCTDAFVAELEKQGVKATRGYNELSERATKEMALAKTKELGDEGLLVCRFMERKSEMDVYPSGPNSMFFGGGYWYGPAFWPSYDYVENKYDVFGTMMYDPTSGKPVWSAVSDTYAGHSEKKVIDSYVKTMMKKMEKQGVIRPGSGGK